MKTRFLITVTFLAISLSSLSARQSHTPPTPAQIVANRVARLTTLLSLNATQQSQATTYFTTEQTAPSGVGASMKAAHTALMTAVEANDAAGITAQATQIGSLTTQEVTARSTANAAFYAILNPTQQTQYKQLMGRGGMGAGFGFRGRP